MSGFPLVAGLAGLLVLTPPEPANTIQGWGSGSVYLDSRRQTTATLNLGASGSYVEYFGFVDLWSPGWGTHPVSGWSFLTEESAFVPLGKSSLAFGGQAALASEFRAVRIGPRWMISKTRAFESQFTRWGLAVQIDVFALAIADLATSSPQSQASAFYSWTPQNRRLQQRLSLSGFADVNLSWIAGRPSAVVVTEHQLAVAVHRQLSFVGEFRFDGFRGGDATGFGFGLQFRLPF